MQAPPVEAIPYWDRGFHYGHGLFETVAVLQGQPLLFEAHLERLQIGLARLRIVVCLTQLKHDVAEFLSLHANATHSETSLTSASGFLKIVVTAGVGPRGYRPPQRGHAHITFSWSACDQLPWAKPAEARSAMLSSIGLAAQPLLAGIKHLNRLEQVLAADELQQCQEAIGERSGLETLPREALLFQHHELLSEFRDGSSDLVNKYSGALYLIEAVSANLFIIESHRTEGCRNNNATTESLREPLRLVTPALTQSGISGVIRRVVLEQAARLGIDAVEAPVTLSRLMQARGAFLTGTGVGIAQLSTVYGFAPALPLMVHFDPGASTLNQWLDPLWQSVRQRVLASQGV